MQQVMVRSETPVALRPLVQCDRNYASLESSPGIVKSLAKIGDLAIPDERL